MYVYFTSIEAFRSYVHIVHIWLLLWLCLQVVRTVMAYCIVIIFGACDQINTVMFINCGALIEYEALISSRVKSGAKKQS